MLTDIKLSSRAGHFTWKRFTQSIARDQPLMEWRRVQYCPLTTSSNWPSYISLNMTKFYALASRRTAVISIGGLIISVSMSFIKCYRWKRQIILGRISELLKLMCVLVEALNTSVFSSVRKSPASLFRMPTFRRSHMQQAWDWHTKTEQFFICFNILNAMVRWPKMYPPPQHNYDEWLQLTLTSVVY